MSDIIGKDKYLQLSKLIHELDIDQLPPEAQRKIFEGLMFDKAKEQMANNINKASFNLNKAINQWIDDTSSSKYTRRTYRHSLNEFLTYLSTRKTHCLDAKISTAIEYRNKLKSQYAYDSVMTKIRSISSFYSYLLQAEYIISNPFKGLKRLKAPPRKKTPYVPSIDAVEALIKSFLDDTQATGRGAASKRKAGLPSAVAVGLMAYRGLRVGIFDSLKIYQGGRFEGTSKGKFIEGNISDGGPDLYSRFKEAGFTKEGFFPSSAALKANIERRIKKLFGKGKFSCHSLRHHFSVQQYVKDKDIYRLKLLLGHESVSTTEKYLQALGL